MISKYDRAAYLAALISIMESKETAGLPRGNTLTQEYNNEYNALIKQIKEQADADGRQEST